MGGERVSVKGVLRECGWGERSDLASKGEGRLIFSITCCSSQLRAEIGWMGRE